MIMSVVTKSIQKTILLLLKFHIFSRYGIVTATRQILMSYEKLNQFLLSTTY